MTTTHVADTAAAAEHFSNRLRFEMDCEDVAHALLSGVSGLYVVDARSPEAFAAAHLPGAVNR